MIDMTEDELCAKIGRHAGELFRSKELLCSEAILVAVNDCLKGGLDRDAAIGLAAALPNGLGGSGCVCGALSGGALALGLLLGNRIGRREIRCASNALHKGFVQANGSTCCRVLCKKFKADPVGHFENCARLTVQGGEATTRIILSHAPELLAVPDFGFLPPRPSRASVALRRVADLLA